MDRPGEASPLQRLREALPGLGGATRRIAEIILESPEQVGRDSITRLAERAGTSPATATRLATALGYDGFPQLRAAVATQHGRDLQAGWERDIGTMIGRTDPPDQVLGTLAQVSATALRDAVAGLDLAAAAAVADAMATAHRIHIVGEWGDAIPAEELQIRLLRIGRPAWFHRGGHEAHIAATLLGPGDVALVVSRSGDHPSGLDFLRTAAERGALTAVVTGEPDAPLAALADRVLATGTRNGSRWTDFFAGRASDALTTGLLWVLTAQRAADRMADLFPADGSGPGTPGAPTPAAPDPEPRPKE